MVPSVLHPCPEGYGNRSESDRDRGPIRDRHRRALNNDRVVPCELNRALYCAQYGCRFPRRVVVPHRGNTQHSVGRDRSTGQAILRFRDEKGRLVAVRLWPKQFRTLANGVLGLAKAEE